MIITGLILFLGVLTWSLKDNLKKWDPDNAPVVIKHGKQGRLRAFLCTPSVIMLAIPAEEWWWALPVAGLMLFFWFLTLFDGFYNVLRIVAGKRFPFFYRGSNDSGAHKDAHTDNFFQGMKQWQHIVIKVGGCTLFTLIYIILLNR